MITTRESAGNSAARKVGTTPVAKGELSHDGFEVDLRDALASTVVRDASFEEFRRALSQYLGKGR